MKMDENNEEMLALIYCLVNLVNSLARGTGPMLQSFEYDQEDPAIVSEPLVLFELGGESFKGVDAVKLFKIIDKGDY